MAPLTISVAAGTAATLLATLLFLLRAEFHGRRPFVVLTRRWIAASNRTSVLTLTMLSVLAVGCFASLSESGSDNSSRPSAQSATMDTDDGAADQALTDLRAYADKIDTEPAAAATASSNGANGQLPDVDTMIAKLVARLEKQPDDVKGWKMLGWSYLNTGMSKDAAKAYETALKLDPNDIEIKKGLERANLGETGSTASPPTINTAGDTSEGAANGMVRGMVDRLAARLEASPNDEAGWTLLMRSWMSLGEKGAAKAALAKAIATFSGDDAAKTRLTAAAREFGVDSD
jgi:cytochrome c-type biogenesis protein CcmH